MKKGLYRTLAWTGIRKNKKLYVPYLLTCAGMVMMCYIVSFLSSCQKYIGHKSALGSLFIQSFVLRSQPG